MTDKIKRPAVQISTGFRSEDKSKYLVIQMEFNEAKKFLNDLNWFDKHRPRTTRRRIVRLRNRIQDAVNTMKDWDL